MVRRGETFSGLVIFPVRFLGTKTKNKQTNNKKPKEKPLSSKTNLLQPETIPQRKVLPRDTESEFSVSRQVIEISKESRCETKGSGGVCGQLDCISLNKRHAH